MTLERRTSRTERREQIVVLTARDRKIVYTVGRFTLASTRHLTALFFTKKNTANKRLRSLFNGGYLRAHLLLGSTSPTVYTLAPYGLRLLVEEMSVSRDLVRVLKTLEVADLHHRLAIIDVRVALVLATRECPRLKLVRFLTGAEIAGEVKTANSGLVPDAAILLERDSTPECLLLEADLGTEPLGVWRRKIALYLRMVASGTAVFSERDWRVLVVATGIARLRSIASVAAESDRADRFVFADFADLVPGTFIIPAWSTVSALADPNARPSLRRNANA